MSFDRHSDDLERFLRNALDIQLAESDDPLTEESLKEIAIKAGLSEDDWSRLCQKLEGHLRKGRNFLTFGNHDEAIIELEQAAALAPYRADILADCGCAHAGVWRETGRRSSRERAEAWFRKCLQIEPGNERAAEQLSALKQARPKASGTVRTPLVAALLALVGAASVWVLAPGPGGPEQNPVATLSDPPPRIEVSPEIEVPTPIADPTSDGDQAPSPTRPPLDGFLDIPWGTATAEAVTMLTERTGARHNPEESTRDRVSFDGGTFAGFGVDRFTLNFENGGFYSAQVQLERTSKDHLNEFLTFKQGLTEKFGPPERHEEDSDLLESTWYFRLPGLPANLINLVGDERRSGVTVLYHSGGTKTRMSQQPAPVPEIPKGVAKDL
ncbi:MAG: hypothetical protein KDN18_07200 [Verrucomicrobiae bacterium]|nr:hypothetical protein [Verrucomicrobiae bacterium]